MDIKKNEFLEENEKSLNHLNEKFDDEKVPEDILAKKAAFTEDGKPIGEAGSQGGGSEKYTAVIYTEDLDSYAGQITVEVDDNTLETYDDLLNYLKGKGYVHNEEADQVAMLSASGYGSGGPTIVIGLYVGLNQDEEARERIFAVGYSRSDYYNDDIAPDSAFSITYLGQD